jgi:hypothetical protein
MIGYLTTISAIQRLLALGETDAGMAKDPTEATHLGLLSTHCQR